MQRRHCLVWVRGIAGPPQPQIWSPDAFHVSQSRIDTSAIAIHELTDENGDCPSGRLRRCTRPRTLNDRRAAHKNPKDPYASADTSIQHQSIRLPVDPRNTVDPGGDYTGVLLAQLGFRSAREEYVSGVRPMKPF